MDFIAIGQQFVQHYYNVFDTARPVLSTLHSFHVESQGAVHWRLHAQLRGRPVQRRPADPRKVQFFRQHSTPNQELRCLAISQQRHPLLRLRGPLHWRQREPSEICPGVPPTSRWQRRILLLQRYVQTQLRLNAVWLTDLRARGWPVSDIWGVWTVPLSWLWWQQHIECERYCPRLTSRTSAA